MSWMQRLYKTYQQASAMDLPDAEKPVPAEHTIQNAHINIVIDKDGKFRRASVLEKTQIILPATETSQNRTGNDTPHALADTIQYVAKDYNDFGGEKKSFFKTYSNQLKKWCDSEFTHPKVRAILTYITKGRVVADLVEHGVLFIDSNKQFIRSWNNKDIETPKIYSVLPKTKGAIDPRTALICWTVEIDNDILTSADTWKDPTLFQSWIDYMGSTQVEKGFCFVSGDQQTIARLHPAKLRHSGDKAKLISSNDTDGLTFNGRFLDAVQAASVGSEISQNAHGALRWLISRQGYKNEDQITVAWAVSGKPVPNPAKDSWDYLNDENDDLPSAAIQSTVDLSTDIGQRAALKLKILLKGYRQNLDNTDQLSIICLDSATPGRMAIVYYREFMPDEYYEALNSWHESFAWFQRHLKEIPNEKGKEKKITVWPQIAPSPFSIAQAAYGKTLSPELKKQVLARILPCIVEGENRSFPFDIVQSCMNRACNRNSGDKWEWERNVGVACALYKGFFARHPQKEKRRFFTMALDEKNSSRDYLYGRLLAVAENLESLALYVAGENRATTAERYMQRFAERPFSAWRNIELALIPYKDRLRKNRAGFLNLRNKEISTIMDSFKRDEFVIDDKLSGEFLLGYHCQKMAYQNRESNTSESDNAENEGV